MKQLPPLLVAAVLVLSACSAPTTAGASVPAPTAALTTAAKTKPKIWKPIVGQSWQIQYAGTLAATTALVVDLDGEATSKADVTALHAQGKKAICYFSAGSYENWRSDRKTFPKKVIGKALPGWPGERWLDIRKLHTLLPIMSKRMDQCKAKGFDAVDPDNMDGYDNAPTGFPLRQKHAAAYLTALSSAAHARGLAIGLKNALDLLPTARPLVEFAVNEECEQYDECGRYRNFVRAGKAVFHVEYTDNGTTRAQACAGSPAGFSTVLKHRDLDAWAAFC